MFSNINSQTREKPMAELEITGLAEIDDDGLFDVIEHRVDSAIEEYCQNMDFSDEINDCIGSYYYWGKLFERELPDLLAQWGYVSEERVEVLVEREVQEAMKAMQPKDERTDDIIEILKTVSSLLTELLGRLES
jgi:hypothetical protein|tara:strand:- start:228 stop:629 length:402 start_codon:yes stop_codon:yes gene_type:complete